MSTKEIERRVTALETRRTDLRPIVITRTPEEAESAPMDKAGFGGRPVIEIVTNVRRRLD